MTNGDKINTGTPEPPHILIAPLDWGLGHITRCIPIIHQFLKRGWRVTLAASGKHAHLLGQEFPNVEQVRVPGYGLRYAPKGVWIKWIIIFQLPKILTAIKQENKWLATYLPGRNIDMVLSDCRFGLHHKNAFCVLMTHQLRIRSPFGKWTEQLLQKWNYSFINRFNECWVPDFEGADNLAGHLSHPAAMPRVPVKYIGGLSRFSKTLYDPDTKHYDLLIILSGPEPQRTILENMMLKALQDYKGKAALVRALPGEKNIASSSHADIFNHLPTNELGSVMMNSNIIISRSGYTTVMDLVKLKKKSILIPTPGQPEQEYLGEYLMEKKLALCIKQSNFSLGEALKESETFAYADMKRFDMEQYKQVINDVALTGKS